MARACDHAPTEVDGLPVVAKRVPSTTDHLARPRFEHKVGTGHLVQELHELRSLPLREVLAHIRVEDRDAGCMVLRLIVSELDEQSDGVDPLPSIVSSVGSPPTLGLHVMER